MLPLKLNGSIVAAALLTMACAGTASPYGDGGADASTDVSGDVRTDQAAVDSAADAIIPGDGSTCSTGTTSSCYSCCAAAHPGSGFELVFYGECELCGGTCGSAKICLGQAPPTGPCFACLLPKLTPTASGWAQCQQSATCTAFVACIKTCPIN